MHYRRKKFQEVSSDAVRVPVGIRASTDTISLIDTRSHNWKRFSVLSQTLDPIHIDFPPVYKHSEVTLVPMLLLVQQTLMQLSRTRLPSTSIVQTSFYLLGYRTCGTKTIINKLWFGSQRVCFVAVAAHRALHLSPFRLSVIHSTH